MTIQRVTCPNCRTAANVSTGMSSVRCGSCGSIWNPAAPEQNQLSPNEGNAANRSENKGGPSTNIGMFVGGVVGGLAALTIAFLAVRFIMNSSARNEPAARPTATSSPVITASEPAVAAVEPYREIVLPLSTRQQIYRDYRLAAGKTVDKRIAIPKNSPARSALENTLSQTLDRDMTQTALIYDITVEDIQEIIKEGNANQWK